MKLNMLAGWVPAGAGWIGLAICCLNILPSAHWCAMASCFGWLCGV
jgi:hypothetical protein